MNKLKKFCAVLICLTAPFIGFSQTLKPIIIKNEGRTLFAFDSIQANYIAKQLAVSLLQKEKIEAQDKLQESLKSEIIEKDKVLGIQEKDISTLKSIDSLRVAQIGQFQIQLNAYRKSDRRAKFGKIFYKALAFTLGATTIYFAIKK